MPAAETDFTNLTESGDAFLADEWPLIVRAVQALAPFFVQQDAGGTEPTHVLEGLRYGVSPNHNLWRLIAVGTDLLVQENTGTEGTPTWTTRNTFATGSGLSVTSDHGGLGGLTDDDHTQYVLATGARNITGSQIVKNSADAALDVTIDAGTAAAQIAELILADQGTDAWGIRKTATGTFVVRDLINNQDLITLNANAGADKIIINSNGVGIGAAAGTGDELHVQGDINATGDVAAATGTYSGALSCATIDTSGSNEVSKAWGSTEQTPSSSSGTLTLDFSASNYFEVLLTENITTITINNTTIPGPRTIVFKQAAASSFTVGGWPSVVWAGDVTPSMPSGFDDEKVITILVKSDASLRGLAADDMTV